MKTKLLLSCTAALAASLGCFALVGCGDDTSSPSGSPGDSGTDSGVDATTSDGSSVDSSSTSEASSDAAVDSTVTDGAVDGGDAGAEGGPPVLGAEIDRFGRPAINTALNHSFDPTPSTAGAAKDAYNANSDAGSWVASYTPEFEKNLAILDSLDTTDAATGCGNQIFAQADAGGAARYQTLASVLADDRLYIDTSSSSCTQYLGVELAATKVLTPPDAGECGGRKLTYEVIKTTYSAVAKGALSGFSDGVTQVAAKTGGTTFPYLAPPQ